MTETAEPGKGAGPFPGSAGGAPPPRRSAGCAAKCVAFLLDLLVVHLAYVFCVSLSLAVLVPQWVAVRGPSLFSGLLGAGLLLAASFPFFVAAYFWLMHAWQGQTVGKMLMAIRVETLQGGEPGPGIAFLRGLGFILAILPLGLGLLWCLIDREKRGWHDLLAATRVAPSLGEGVEIA